MTTPPSTAHAFDPMVLVAALDSERVLTDPAITGAYAHDDAEWAPFALPLAVVLPRSTEEVAEVVRAAVSAGVAVVPRGAGTGLSGGANSSENAIVVSLELMQDVLQVDVEERYAVTQAGVINDALRARVAIDGLWYPPDPASSNISTIGGNVATNAGGICSVKYGVTRDYVIALKVVLADGSIVSVGRTTAKGVTGYDLVGLLVGSEGTLGIITEVTVRLLPLRSHPTRAVVGYFNSLADAGRAVAAVSRLSTVPGALELIDRTCLRAVTEWKGLALPVDVEAMLLIRIEEPGDAGAAAIDEIVRCLEDSGGSDVRQAHSEAEADLLFLARRLAYPALERLGPVLTEDVCVPKRRVPDMLLRIQAAARDHDVVIANIAHAGDGNLHPLIVVPEGDEAAKSRAKLAFDQIVADCLDLGGTVTGEHGVGLLKLAGAEAELPRRVLQLHSDIKDALDPNGTLNPGKAFPGSHR